MKTEQTEVKAAVRAARQAIRLAFHHFRSGAAADVLRRDAHHGPVPIACVCDRCLEAWRIAHRLVALTGR